MTTTRDEEKEAVAEAALSFIRDGMRVGLGTGTTIEHLLALLPRHARDVTYVASSPRTEQLAAKFGLLLEPFADLDRLDITIDGADQVAPSRWLVKGGGGAHTREKILAAAAECFVVIVSENKLVDEIHPPIPLELLPFGVAATLRALAPSALRNVPRSPDGGLLADYHGPIEDPAALAARLSEKPGVIEHGLFPASLIGEILVSRGTDVEHLRADGCGRHSTPPAVAPG